ncbi:phage tail protein, partial [Atlantibacter hermannii]
AALNDDPNFAATMTAELSKKMDKASNGADIPDVAAFLNNLGLKEAAKRAVGTGAGQIPDMSAFEYVGNASAGYVKLPNGF